MKNWEYKELIETIEESYFDLLNQKEEPDQAVSRVFEDFYFQPENENRVENLITSITTMKLRAEKLGYVYETEVRFLKKQFSEVSDELLNSELLQEEVTDLKVELVVFFSKLDNVEIRIIDNSSNQGDDYIN